MATVSFRSDVKYFEGIVKLDNAPGELRPGMSAEVEIAMPRVDHVLTVPSNAVQFENGHEYCFVVHEDSLEQREIELGRVTSDLTEVTRGLHEGEEVIIDPRKDDVELQELSVRTELAAEDIAPRHDAPHDASRGVVAALH